MPRCVVDPGRGSVVRGGRVIRERVRGIGTHVAVAAVAAEKLPDPKLSIRVADDKQVAVRMKRQCSHFAAFSQIALRVQRVDAAVVRVAVTSSTPGFVFPDLDAVDCLAGDASEIARDEDDAIAAESKVAHAELLLLDLQLHLR